MAKLLRNSTTKEVMLKNRNGSMEVIRGMTEEVRGVSSFTYDLTLVCKGGATVRKINQNRCCHQIVFISPSSPT